MTQSECPPAFQKFMSTDGTPLTSLRCHRTCAVTGHRHLLWSDIKYTFEGIDHLETTDGQKVQFAIGAEGEQLHPFCIKYSGDEAYIVISSNSHHGNQTEEPCHTEQERVDSFSINQALAASQIQVATNSRYYRLMLMNEFEKQEEVGAITLPLNRGQRSRRENIRRDPQAFSNTLFHHSMLLEEIEKQDEIEASAPAVKKNQRPRLEKPSPLRNQMSNSDYRRACRGTLNDGGCKWDCALSKLFIVLPSDLDSWDGLNPSTHRFRIYFMCDNWNNHDSLTSLPQHIHLSNHPGYRLTRPQEFFHQYGDYALRLLLMIKHGYTSSSYEVPSLDTLKIFWKPEIFGRNPISDNIEYLVDMAIDYLEELSPPTWKQLGLSRSQSATIKTFLIVEDGDNTEGNLHRYISSAQFVCWRCDAHAQQYLNREYLVQLREFICGLGGIIDMQQAVIKINIGSTSETDKFLSLLDSANHRFNIFIKLNWRTTWAYVKELCMDVSKKKSVSLAIDGLTLVNDLQALEKTLFNPFSGSSDSTESGSGLQFITFLNYPRPQEYCIHFRRLSLQSTRSPARLAHRWVELRDDLQKFRSLVCSARVAADCNAAASELHTVLKRYGDTKVTLVTIYGDSWSTVFDLRKGAFVQAYSQHTACPNGILSSGSLQELTVELGELAFDQDLFRLVQTNTGLQDLNVSYCGHDALYYAENIIKMRHSPSRALCLSLFDRMRGAQDRLTAKLIVQGSEGENPVLDVVHGKGFNPAPPQRQSKEMSASIVSLLWECDHVSSQLTNHSASLLAKVTQHHPSVLTLFTLDMSQLSAVGCNSMEMVLRRSRLEHFNVMCGLIDSSLSNSITQVLGSLQWFTLKSLVLSGNRIDEWIKLWSPPVSPQLHSLQVRGTGATQQELSHISVLFIHQLVYASSLLELHLEHIQLQDKSDWALVVDGLDPALLQAFDLHGSSRTQFMATTSAVDLIRSRFLFGGNSRGDSVMHRSSKMTRRLKKLKRNWCRVI